MLLGDCYSSKTPFEELTPIKLRDLQVPKVHIGRYLVVQILIKPAFVVGMNTLIEDLNGKPPGFICTSV